MTSDALASLGPAPLVVAPDPSGSCLVWEQPAPRGGRYAHIKPALDFVLVLLLLPPALVLIALATVAVKLSSSGPAFYSQTRVGLNGRRFTLWKVRTMYHRCEALTGPRWSTPGDGRVTPVGRFLRAAHLDELPQLWNVLRGDMSLVGPRPERPEIIESAALSRLVPGYDERVSVKPGVTGLAQILLPPDTDIESVRRKVAVDLWYVENLGPWLDFRILVGTFLKVAGLAPRLPRRAPGFPQPRAAVPTEPSLPRESAPTAAWRSELAEILNEPQPAPAPAAQPDARAVVRSWFHVTALPALYELAAELRRHERSVRVSAPAPEEAWIRVWAGRTRELDLKLRVRGGPSGPRVYARVLVREGRRDFVHEYPIEKPIAEVRRADVIAFVLARYRALTGVSSGSGAATLAS